MSHTYRLYSNGKKNIIIQDFPSGEFVNINRDMMLSKTDRLVYFHDRIFDCFVKNVDAENELVICLSGYETITKQFKK